MNNVYILQQYNKLIDKDFDEVNSFKKYREGKLSKDYIIAQYYRLAFFISKKFKNTGLSEDDKISILLIGLLKSIDKFDEDKGIKFATFCSRVMTNEMLMELRKSRKTKGYYINNLEDAITIDSDGNQLTLLDIIPDEFNLEERIENSFLFQELLEKINNLKERDKYIIYRRIIINDITQKELSDELNISQSYISRLERSIMNKIRKKVITS